MCPDKYISQSSGYKCHPIIVKVTHKFNIRYRCYGWRLVHTERGPEVGDPICTNCKMVNKIKEDKGNVRTTTFWIASAIEDDSSGCDPAEYVNAKAVFLISPPQREWNGGDPPPNQSAPFTTWDSKNPYFDVKAYVQYGTQHDSDKYVYNRTSNPNPSSDFSVPSDQRRYLIVKVDNGELSVHIKREDDG